MASPVRRLIFDRGGETAGFSTSPDGQVLFEVLAYGLAFTQPRPHFGMASPVTAPIVGTVFYASIGNTTALLARHWVFR